MPSRLLITGSRDWTDHDSVHTVLKDWWLSTGNDPEAVLVSGNCPTGADRIAESIWENQGLAVERYPADWKRLGRSAGPKRNQAMVDLKPDAAAAFIRAGSRGASGTLKMIERAGIPVRVYWDERKDNDLPLLISKPCCDYKVDCGDTDLYLCELPGDPGEFEYRRVSNTDSYFGPAPLQATLEFIQREGPRPW